MVATLTLRTEKSRSELNRLKEPILTNSTATKVNRTPNLLADLVNWAVCRHTVRGRNGTYAFSAIQGFKGYDVTMDYWQDYPEDEATERTLLRAKTVPTPVLAVKLLFLWISEERERDFQGYDERKEAKRAILLG